MRQHVFDRISGWIAEAAVLIEAFGVARRVENGSHG
jgi:hypothetical protein